MEEVMKKIVGLENNISSLENQDYLTESNYYSIHESKKEIKDLWPLVTSRIAIRLSYKDKHYSQKPFFLAPAGPWWMDDEPVFYETKEEAARVLDKAKLEPDKYNIEIVEYGANAVEEMILSNKKNFSQW